MRLCKMDFQVLILFVIHVFVVLPAQMAGQVVAINVVEETQIVKQKLLAKVAVRMGKHVSVSAIRAVSVLNVASQCFDMVKSLFSNKNSSSFQAYLAESLFMLSFHVSLQRGHVRKLLR